MATERIILPFLFVFVACGHGGDEEVILDGGGADSGSNCEAVESPDWVTPMLIEVVAKLTGNQEIAPGIRLQGRSDPASRLQTRQYLTDELASLGFEVELQDYGTGVNIVAQLQGGASGTYILGAHFDSVPGSPGANDNATGVAAVMATARYMREQDCSRSHNIRFVFFDEEELGLVGSRAYAQKLNLESDEILGVYTIDQMGWDMDGDRRIEIELPGRGMLDEVVASITRHSTGIEVTETNTAGSDHTAFREQGYLALGFTEEFVSGDTTPFYHLGGDTFDTVDFDFLLSSTIVLQGLFSDLTEGQ